MPAYQNLADRRMAGHVSGLGMWPGPQCGIVRVGHIVRHALITTAMDLLAAALGPSAADGSRRRRVLAARCSPGPRWRAAGMLHATPFGCSVPRLGSGWQKATTLRRGGNANPAEPRGCAGKLHRTLDRRRIIKFPCAKPPLLRQDRRALGSAIAP